MNKLISMILVLAMLFSLAACGMKPEANTAANPSAGDGPDATPPGLMLSPEDPSATVDGVTVNIGEFVLEGEAELSVRPLPAEITANGECRIVPYDISVGDMHELGEYITIRIPYDGSFCDEGQDPAKCVGAKYKNDETGEWEDVLFEVDAGAQELVIYTDHLSQYGAFYVKNEGRRNAYITDVYSGGADIAEDDAIAALQEMAAGGGNAGENVFKLGAKALDETLGGVADGAGIAGSALDIYGTAMSLATLGEPAFDSTIATRLNDGLGDLGKAVAMVKIGSVMLKTDKTDAEVLGLYKDCASLALSFASTAAMGVATGGLYIFDQIITKMFEESNAAKLDRVNAVYMYFNTHDFPFHHAKTAKDWRKDMIEIAEKNTLSPENIQTELNGIIDAYCNDFWTQEMFEHWEEVLSHVVEQGGQLKDSFLPTKLTQSEIQQMTDEYKAEFYRQLVPVSRSVGIYFQKKAEQEYLKTLNSLKKEYNKIVTIKIIEELPENGEPHYSGYTVRFGPLSDAAVKDNWTGKLSPDGDATVKTTIIGFIIAGKPTQIILYPPDANPDTDEPELTVNYVLGAPETEVRLAGAPPLSYVLGNYENGTLTLTDVYASDEYLAMAQENAGTDPDSMVEGCDISALLQSLEEQIGVENALSFQLLGGDAPNAGSLLTGEGDNSIPFTYQSGKLILNLSLTEDGATESYIGELKCEYTEDKGSIRVSGFLKISYAPADRSGDWFYVVGDLAGTKVLN